MARLFTTGFETQKQTTDETMHGEANAAGLLADHTGFTFFDTTNQRTGNASYLCSQGSYFQVHSVVTTFARAYYYRVYIRFNDTTPTNNIEFLVQEVNGQKCAYLRLNTDGTVTAHDFAGTQRGSATAALTANQYYRFEMRFLLPSSAQTTTGQLRARLNGTDFCNVTNANFGGVHVSPANGHIKMGWTNNVASSGNGIYMDDVAINDGTGPVGQQESWPGPGRVKLAKPVSDSAIGITWKNSVAGGLWSSVDNRPPTGEPHPEEPPPPTGGDTNETRLWTGADKMNNIADLEPYYDAGFTSFIYASRTLSGLGGNAYEHERTAMWANAQGRDYSNDYAGFWMDTPESGPPLDTSWLNSGWNARVLPAIESFVDKAMDAGFKGISFDQELYFQPQLPNNYPFGWRWDYNAGETESAVRAAAYAKGLAVGQRITQVAGPNLPCVAYHFSVRNALDTCRSQSAIGKQMARNYVQREWMQGLIDGGIDLRLLDSDYYKDTGIFTSATTNLAGQYDDGTQAPDLDHNGEVQANWTATANFTLDKTEQYWGEDMKDRWEPFVWLTAGPNATKAINLGQNYSNIWDRQRSVTHINSQITGLRLASVNPNNNMTCYAYNLVGGAAQYDAMTGFPGS